MDFSIFSSFLPEGLLSHFDIVDFKELDDLQTLSRILLMYWNLENRVKGNLIENDLEKRTKVFGLEYQNIIINRA